MKHVNWIARITSLGTTAASLAVAASFAAQLAPTLAQAEHWGEKDKLQEFVTNKNVVTNARQIDARGLNRVGLKNRPWSSTYWPDKMGSLAWRYESFGDGSLSYKKDMLLGWDSNRPKVVSNKTFMMSERRQKPLSSFTQAQLDMLSPAEKYDILMGDPEYTLWNRVVDRVDQLQKLDLHALWSGVCHGWAPAALMIDRPTKTVVMDTPSGVKIKFFPDDIKALAALLWGNAFGTEGNAQNFTKVEGWQCQTGAKKNPNGRLVDPRCSDVNAGFFHLLLVNQLGVNKRGLVLDRHYRAEVQNQPVFAYEFKYFKVNNRGDMKTGLTLNQAKVSLKSSYWDPFSNYRSKKAVNIVGVEAKVWYSMGNINPDHKHEKDDASKDKVEHLTIRYDLELDAADEIVGGEWREHEIIDAPTLAEQHKYQHPDIMWLIPPGVKALSPGDFANITPWDGNGPAPADWLEASKKAANKKYGDRVRGKQIVRVAPQPLAKVVEILVKKSRE